MLDADELGRLRRQISLINRKFANGTREPKRAPIAPRVRSSENSARSFVEEWHSGQIVENDCGRHFQTERLFASHKAHGSADVGALADLSEDFLEPLGCGSIPQVSPGRWAFLDTETTGLAGGPDTYAFLIGVGRITPKGFLVRQFFMREYAEESSILAELHAHLNNFDVLITYNGKSYDQPLLEARYFLRCQRSPLPKLHHVDLLHGARRLWKLRMKNCRLMQLEEQILGVYREGDLPGELIPYVYFEYLRSREALRLVPIFHHNAMDILTLACLTAIVPAAFHSTDSESLERLGLQRGEDLASIANWLLAARQPERALEVLNRSIQSGLPDRLLFRALWDIALIEKKRKRHAAALAGFTELATCRNDYRVCALEELSKHYEHEARDYALALEFTNQALAYQPSATLEHRRTRLERHLAKPRRSARRKHSRTVC